jgi:hypothetical protein
MGEKRTDAMKLTKAQNAVGYDGTVLWSHAYETQYAAAAVSAAMRATGSMQS